MKLNLSEEDEKLLDTLAGEIVKRELATPAIFLLETVKPLNCIGSNFMIFLSPFVSSLFTIKEYDQVIAILEQRDSLEYFIQKIEKLDYEKRRKAQDEKKSKKGRN